MAFAVAVGFTLANHRDNEPKDRPAVVSSPPQSVVNTKMATASSAVFANTSDDLAAQVPYPIDYAIVETVAAPIASGGQGLVADAAGDKVFAQVVNGTVITYSTPPDASRAMSGGLLPGPAPSSPANIHRVPGTDVLTAVASVHPASSSDPAAPARQEAEGSGVLVARPDGTVIASRTHSAAASTEQVAGGHEDDIRTDQGIQWVTVPPARAISPTAVANAR